MTRLRYSQLEVRLSPRIPFTDVYLSSLAASDT